MKKKIAQLGQSYSFPAETKERNGIAVNFPAYTVMQVSEPQKPRINNIQFGFGAGGINESDEWPKSSHKFIFTINGKTFDYYTGLGHRQAIGFEKKEFKRLSGSNINDHGLRELLKISRATLPDIEELFYCLSLDSSAESMAFSDWCADCGYDTDSRKALKTYEACQENAVKMRGLVNVSAEKLQEYFQDY